MAHTQTFEEYVKLRKKNGITRAADVAEIEDFVGKRVIEIQGTVKGVIGSGDSELLLVEGLSGVQHYVRSKDTPSWLKNGQVQVRLIVDAERTAQGTMLGANLLGAAGESEVLAYEAKIAPVRAVRPSIRGSISPSRRGNRPGPMQGDVPTKAIYPESPPTAGVSANLAAALPAYVAFIKKRDSRLDDSQAERIAESILAYSSHFGVDARLIVAIIIAYLWRVFTWRPTV